MASHFVEVAARSYHRGAEKLPWRCLDMGSRSPTNIGHRCAGVTATEGRTASFWLSVYRIQVLRFIRNIPAAKAASCELR
jgi:hypothetical protein